MISRPPKISTDLELIFQLAACLAFDMMQKHHENGGGMVEGSSTRRFPFERYLRNNYVSETRI